MDIAPDELGPLRTNEDPYERVNLWMLERAARFGAARMIFTCLWNGEGGDGPGGTKHLMDAARRNSAPVHWLNTQDALELRAGIRIARASPDCEPVFLRWND